MILVISRKNDVHGQFMVKQLQSIGEDVSVLDFSNYPTFMSGTYISRKSNETKLTLTNGRCINSSEVKSVLDRRRDFLYILPGKQDGDGCIEGIESGACVIEGPRRDVRRKCPIVKVPRSPQGKAFQLEKTLPQGRAVPDRDGIPDVGQDVDLLRGRGRS